MWFLSPQKHEIATFSVTPRHVRCSWIGQRSNKYPLELLAYRIVELPHHAIKGNTLFNLTGIGDIIRSFLKAQQLTTARICISLFPPLIRNAIITSAHPDPTSYATMNGHNQSPWTWQHHYLHPNDRGGFVFYACGIPQTLRLQWQLLSASIDVDLALLTSNHMTLFSLYKAMYGNAFRQSQLALHMAQTDNEIDHLFTVDSLGRIMHIPRTLTIDRKGELPFLLSACGLFLSERSNA